jgi:purine-binding chemotaxis protein CheW
MVAVTPAPEARPEAAGVINIHGRIVPVVDLRPWFGQTARPPRLDDRLLLIEAGERTAALVVDDVAGVLEVPPRDVKPASTFMHDARPVVAAIRRGDDLVLVLDAVALLPRRGDIGAEGDGQDGMVSGSTRRELISQKGDL